MYDCIILGAGPAGVSAGIFCSKNNLKTLIVAKELSPHLPQPLSTEIIKHSGQVNGNLEFKKSNIINIEKNFTSFQVEDSRGESYYSKAIIIATGCSYAESNIPEVDELWNKKVFPLNSLIPSDHPKNTVAVYGSGFEVVKSIYLLAKQTLNIISINPKHSFSVNDSEKQKIEGKSNITFKNSSIIKKIHTKSGKLFIEIDNGKTQLENVEADNLFIEQEFFANTHFDLLTSKDTKGFIKTNALMETGVPGVYAAGDCTGSTGGNTGVSEGQGLRAALSVLSYILKLV